MSVGVEQVVSFKKKAKEKERKESASRINDNNFTPDSPPWLSTFSQPCERWEGLHLTPELDTAVQAKIRSKEVTLLEFRNYLFQRQCALLLLLNKPWEASDGSNEG